MTATAAWIKLDADAMAQMPTQAEHHAINWPDGTGAAVWRDHEPYCPVHPKRLSFSVALEDGTWGSRPARDDECRCAEPWEWGASGPLVGGSYIDPPEPEWDDYGRAATLEEAQQAAMAAVDEHAQRKEEA